jgi:hypothetical protein
LLAWQSVRLPERVLVLYLARWPITVFPVTLSGNLAKRAPRAARLGLQSVRFAESDIAFSIPLVASLGHRRKILRAIAALGVL